MISAKQINNLISQDKFDAEAAMKKVSELETLVAQAKEDKGGMISRLLIRQAGINSRPYKYVRRVRDKVRTLAGIRATAGRKLKLDGRRLFPESITRVQRNG